MPDAMIQVRVDADLFEAAKAAGAAAGRSAAAQIRHWAGIGRALETRELLEDAQDVAAFDASMAEECANIPWAPVEATEKAQRAAQIEGFAKLRELDEALEEPEYVETEPSIREVTRRLNAALGDTLVAALAGSDDPKAPHEWAKEDSLLPGNGIITRLAFAYAQWQKIAEYEGERVARMWFVGANPWLDNDTPANAIREGHHEEVARAAQALIDDSFSG
ncbi:hypothetical protein QMG61_05140 [Cryobacterium sp. PH31-AA6]|uniref:TA system antitoxin ParD family protein n=1 Tax=Cryobacterium sp. PH31-AA6 TaxID=3046205 RepID=UPI0024B9F059|nr:hypothetical protein [Cryobacterium sp. PH31-AA6]MDJ0323147.1 hypothetical protein [Cryobacterium sp. PH31-AA6]